MIEKKIIEGKNKEDILQKYLDEYEVNENDIHCFELKPETGLFKGKKVKLEIISKQDIINYIKDFFDSLSNKMNIDIKIEVREINDSYNIMLITDNNPVVIGKDGKTLDAIQLLLKQSILNKTGHNFRISVDIANYKKGKQKNFEYEIKKIAKEVLYSKVEVKLDPMNSFNRRIVHTILSEFNDLETESFGEEPNRYVVIKHKEK